MKIKFILGLVALVLGIFVGSYVLPYHFSGQYPISDADLTGMFNPDTRTGSFHGQLAQVHYIPPRLALKNILGDTTSNKRIEVDLTNQRLYAFEDNNKIFDFLISSGKWGRTPTGEFNIWIKLRYTKMEGGSKALNTYYYLPNVPFVMYFENAEIPSWRGFGIHGTYWHSNFGHPMSHGCINMKTEEVEQLYYWANPTIPEGRTSVRSTPENPGTKVIIYGEAPAV